MATSVPLMGGRDSSGLGRSRKGVLLLAAASILLALATVTLSVRKSGPMQLLEMPWKSRVQRRVAAPAPTAAAMRPTISLANVAPARPQALLQAEPASAQMSKAGNVVYYYMPPAAKSPLHGLAAGQKLAAPAPGTYVAPMPGDGPICDLWTLQTLADNTQLAWTQCMTNRNYKEPNSIAQEIYDELDSKSDGTVTPKEYCDVARAHTARLTDDQCKEIVRLMDEAAGDNDGVLTFAEFKTAFLTGQEPPEEEEEEEAARRRRRRHLLSSASQGARRHLLSWVWVPGKGVEPAVKPFPVADFHSLADFKRSAVSMDECKTLALGDVCSQIGKCPQPVCSDETMYNDTKVESLCGMCTLAGEVKEASGDSGGCFALHGLVQRQGAGHIEVANVAVGDMVASADGYSRVIFTHEHTASYSTVKLAVGGDVMELTSDHQVPVYTKQCGPSYCHSAGLMKAKHVAIGDRLYLSDGNGSTVGTVSATSKGQARVKYVVTESGNLIVNGVVASVFSTMARHFETLPFYFLDKLCPGIFEVAPVKAALYAVLESPALAFAEGLVDVLMSFKAPVAAPHPSVAMGLAVPTSA